MVVPFAKSVFICGLNTFLQETWLNDQGLLEALDTSINNLPNSTLKGGIEMIKYLINYLTVLHQSTDKNKTQGKAKVPSE